MIKLRIGRHIDVNHGFVTSPSYAKSIGCTIMQIFLGVPYNVISKSRSVDELKKFSIELEKNDMMVIIHGAYTINLCHPIQNKLFKVSIESLVRDLNASNIIGNRCYGVIIHMGKNIPANHISNTEALNNYIQGLKIALGRTPVNTTIILETGASQGTEIASTIPGLHDIYYGLTENERTRVNFCIDTCHIWATGYNISTPTGVSNFFKEFVKLIGNNKITCFHLNDSKGGLASHVDRHADLGYGTIGLPGLKAVVTYAKKHHIPIITETPLDSVDTKTNKEVTFEGELAKIKSWLK